MASAFLWAGRRQSSGDAGSTDFHLEGEAARPPRRPLLSFPLGYPMVCLGQLDSPEVSIRQQQEPQVN